MSELYDTNRIDTHAYDPADPATRSLLVGRVLVVDPLGTSAGHFLIQDTPESVAQALQVMAQRPCLVCAGGGNHHQPLQVRLTQITLPERPVNAELLNTLQQEASSLLITPALLKRAGAAFPFLLRRPAPQHPDAQYLFAQGEAGGQTYTLRVSRWVNKRFGTGLTEPQSNDHEMDIEGLVSETGWTQGTPFHAQVPADQVQAFCAALLAGPNLDHHVVPGFIPHEAPEAVVCGGLYLMLRSREQASLSSGRPVQYVTLGDACFSTLAGLLQGAVNRPPFDGEGVNPQPFPAALEAALHDLPPHAQNLWIDSTD